GCSDILWHVNGELIVTPDVPRAFVDHVVECYRSRPREEFAIALSGGETARACYERLAAEGAEAIDWWKVDVYWGDERCVPPDSPDANQLLGRQALLERVGAANSIRPMRCDDGPEPYQLMVGELGFFDVVHLGLGPDGHTASLFPDSPTLQAPEHETVALARDPHERNPHDRMTLTLPGIARARLAVFTVAGEGKRAAFTAVRAGADLPASRVRAGRVVWLADRAASG
ncbi:MAG TPA: 6-phosphogluconolactonase, partial [Acidimicrobiales bacterium]|nr:6-phosphogluconolactonase [Acidimicrobiales bacterium]